MPLHQNSPDSLRDPLTQSADNLSKNEIQKPNTNTNTITDTGAYTDTHIQTYADVTHRLKHPLRIIRNWHQLQLLAHIRIHIQAPRFPEPSNP